MEEQKGKKNVKMSRVGFKLTPIASPGYHRRFENSVLDGVLKQ